MNCSELAPGQVVAVEVNGVAVAMCNLDGEFHALGHWCPHQDGPLGEGWLEDGCLICPWHAWSFEVKTGQHPLIPGVGVPKFTVRVEGDNVFVEV